MVFIVTFTFACDLITVKSSSTKTRRCRSSALLPSNCDYTNSTPKSINIFRSTENLLLSLSKVSKHFAECQDASEGYSSGNILDLSPIQPVNSSSNHGDDQNPVTRYETAFGPDNKTVTRVFYADGIATDFNHVQSGVDVARTPVETHFDDSPPEGSKPFSRKNSLRHSMHNLFNRGSSNKEKKMKSEKNSARRKSTGVNLNEDSNYGCTVGVYSRKSPNSSTSSSSSYTTPVSRAMPVTRSESVAAHGSHGDKVRRRSYNGKPPPYSMTPSNDALYPESMYPRPPQPVIDASKKSVKRKKSMSSTSLNQRSFLDSRDSGMKNSSLISNKSQNSKVCDKEVIVGRSLSMSDLAAAPPPVENELQKQCMGKIQESGSSKLN